jgi:hypothetical protein
MICAIGARSQTGASTTLNGLGLPVVAATVVATTGLTDDTAGPNTLRTKDWCRLLVVLLPTFEDRPERSIDVPGAGDWRYVGLSLSRSFLVWRSAPLVEVGAGSQTHDEPWLHVPCPVEGQLEKSHTKPQAPQLFGSV